jgi:hypothetical protein
MAFETLNTTNPVAFDRRPAGKEPLSQNGQMIGWFVYGALLIVGFGFGIVTGYERPKPVTVTKVVKEEVKPEVAKADTPKPAPKPAETPTPPTQPITTTTPKETPATPKTDPKLVPTPKTETPKPDPPKPDPKPTTPVATTTPKPDPKPTTPQKEDLKPVSFKKDVVPILRSYCFTCHGDSKGKPKGDVDLTSIAKMMKSPGKLVVAGMPEKSDLYDSITGMRMPPDGKPGPNKDELLVLKNWILTGAKE